MVAAIFSLSALLWAASSPFWARQSDIRGRKPLMIVGLAGFAISMLLCGLVVSAGLARLAAPMVIFALFLVARAIFGFFGAASNPATQAFVAERTSADERTQWMSNLAGAFSLGTVVGPVAAPVFIVAVLEFAGPLYAFAVIAAVMLAVVARYLREAPVGPATDAPPPPRRGLWRDRRLVPFIVYSFLLSTCQSALGQTLGFLIIDKTHKAFPQLAPDTLLHIAQGYIEVAMVAGALAGLMALWGFIRMFSMTPRSLLRWGAALAALGNLIVAFAPDYATATIGYGLASLGFSFARPGFTAGASLVVGMEDQAGAAGAIAAVNGVNIVVAPFAVSFYKVSPEGPFVVAAIVLAGLLVYAWRDPILRDVGRALSGEDLAIEATLERSDEGAGA
jgi:predicted MFS family arabinose efflux permease